jgi:peptidoglycan/xylan/chitin deacetylase (PgdA/CDA1 family)
MVNLDLIKKARHTARRIRSLSAPYGLILLYHRIAEPSTDPQAMCVTPSRFAEHLEVLRQIGRPVPLQQLARSLREKKRESRAVALTFDDGYADNLTAAKPLLARYEIPATVFVTTGDIGRERAFWWEELEQVFLRPGALPETLNLEINGQRHQWQLGAAAHYSDDDLELHRHWNLFVNAKHDPGPRQRCYRALNSLLHALPHEEKQRLTDELLDWASAQPIYSPAHRILSQPELSRLAEGDLVEIGSHTITHPMLSLLPASAQSEEIELSKTRLEEITGRSVTSFAYPYGSRSSYNKETMSLVRAAGYSCACANSFDAVWRYTDAFQLPRVIVGDWDGETFARLLRWLMLN